MTQKEALDILKLGHNAYITGPAGSGKTHLLNQYISYLDENGVDVGITASTGIAATHMGGVTIHSWSGLGIRDTITDYDLETMLEKPYLWKRMERVKVLIIDEISMLHHFRLDLVEKIIQAFKRNDRSFGGIQIILCGDFFQLPPVSRYGEPDAHFAYHSESWKNAGFKICYLEEQYRQTDDHALTILNDIRGNRVGESTRAHLRKCFKENKKENEGVPYEPTRLYTHNIDVDKVNDTALEMLDSTSKSYQMHTSGNDMLVSILKKSCLAPERLRLKVGARVMFVKNDFEAGFANGTLGVVRDLEGKTGAPVVEIVRTAELIDVPMGSWTIEEDGKVKAELQQYPLRLAWAITVHKSQGMSLDAVEVDLSKSFEKGMGYVALSRVRTLAGLTILGMNNSALEVNEDVLVHDEELQDESKKAVELLHTYQKKGILKEAQQKYLALISESKAKKVAKLSTYELTYQLIKEELLVEEMAKKRAVTEQTIIDHLEKIISDNPDLMKEINYIRKAIPAKRFVAIEEGLMWSFEKNGDWRLSPAKEYVDKNKKKLKISPAVTYREVQLVRLFVKSDNNL